jgi:hypothetical protein
MRRLNYINGFEDIYQPVPQEDIEAVESQLGFAFPEAYKRFVQHPDIETIKRLPSLLWYVLHQGVGILDVNRFLRGREHDPYPDQLIAFATNECGDYFCFDRDTGRVFYIDPDCSVRESLESGGLSYESFERWLGKHLERDR